MENNKLKKFYTRSIVISRNENHICLTKGKIKYIMK